MNTTVPLAVAVAILLAGLVMCMVELGNLQEKLEAEKKANEELAKDLAELNVLRIQLEDLNKRLDWCHIDLNTCEYYRDFYKNRYELLKEYANVLTGAGIAVSNTSLYYVLMLVSPEDLNCDSVFENYATDYAYLDDYQNFIDQYRKTLVDIGIFESEEAIDEDIMWTKTIKSWLASAYNYCLERYYT